MVVVAVSLVVLSVSLFVLSFVLVFVVLAVIVLLFILILILVVAVVVVVVLTSGRVLDHDEKYLPATLVHGHIIHLTTNHSSSSA